MSINAYRMKGNNLDSEVASFDVWHDKKFMEFLDEEIQFYMILNSFSTGIVDVPVDLLEKAVHWQENLDLDDDTIEQINLDVEYAKSNKDKVVTYYCF